MRHGRWAAALGVVAFAMLAPFARPTAAAEGESRELDVRGRLLTTARAVEAAEAPDAERDPSGELRTFVRGLGLELGLGAAPADGGDGVWRIQVRNGRGDVAIAHVRDDGQVAAVVRCATLPAERFVPSRFRLGSVAATTVVEAAPEVRVLARLARWSPGPGDRSRDATCKRWMEAADPVGCAALIDLYAGLQEMRKSGRFLRITRDATAGVVELSLGRNLGFRLRANRDGSRFAALEASGEAVDGEELPTWTRAMADALPRAAKAAHPLIAALRSGDAKAVSGVALDVFSADVRAPSDDVVARWIALGRSVPLPPASGEGIGLDVASSASEFTYVGPGVQVIVRRVGTSWRIAHVEPIAGPETVPVGDVVGR